MKLYKNWKCIPCINNTKMLLIFALIAITMFSCKTDDDNTLIVNTMFNISGVSEISNKAQSLTILVETNIENYKVDIGEEAQSWISRDTLIRDGNNKIETFLVQANLNTEPRSVTITFTAENISKQITITQKAGEEDEGANNGKVEIDKLYGYGENTTGGEGATAENILHFNDGICFRDYLALREKNKDETPAIIYLSGKFTSTQGRDTSSPWYDIKRTHNLSIYGTDGFIMENVGFFIRESSNIIIRNVYIKMPKADNGADGISMQKSQNIWVDHCTFESMNQSSDYEDGSCDITHATNAVTVSWCHFIKTQKSCLVGHSNSETGDIAITATFHHNFFDLSSSRHPRVRFGKAHVYNNYFNQVSTYGVGSAYGARVLVENNNFEAVRLPIDICTYPAKQSGNNWVSNLTGSVAGYIYELNNIYNNKPTDAGDIYPFTNVEYESYGGNKIQTPYTYTDFKPDYNYIADDAEEIPSIVTASAGVGKLAQFAEAPIDVNNGGFIPGDNGNGEGNNGNEVEENTLANGWYWISYNGSDAQATVNSGILSLEANGKFESGNQAFGYVYRELVGNFVATVQIDSYATQATNNQSLAGLMFTPDFNQTGTNFIHCMAAQGPNNSFYRSTRESVANASRGGLNAPVNANGVSKPIVKIERLENDCKLSYSLDGGETFGAERIVSFTDLPNSVYVGVAVSSGNSSEVAVATFSNFRKNEETIAF